MTKALVLGSFFMYVPLFVVLQRIIGARCKAQPIRVPRDSIAFHMLVMCSTVVLSVSLLLTPKYKAYDDYTLLRVVGGVAALMGLVISMWAQAQLGRQWVAGVHLRKGHQLITTGLYSRVRHPLYSGMLVSAVGIGAVTLDWLYFVSVLLFVGAYLSRIPAEEHLLQKKFRRKYDDYKARSGAILPRLRR